MRIFNHQTSEKAEKIQAEKDKIAQGFKRYRSCNEWVGPLLNECPFCGARKNESL